MRRFESTFVVQRSVKHAVDTAFKNLLRTQTVGASDLRATEPRHVGFNVYRKIAWIAVAAWALIGGITIYRENQQTEVTDYLLALKNMEGQRQQAVKDQKLSEGVIGGRIANLWNDPFLRLTHLSTPLHVPSSCRALDDQYRRLLSITISVDQANFIRPLADGKAARAVQSQRLREAADQANIALTDVCKRFGLEKEFKIEDFQANS